MKAIKKPTQAKTRTLLAKKSVTPKKPVEVSLKKDAPGHISLPVLSPKGEKVGTMSLSKEFFGIPYNRQLVSQAMRVYQMNQREGSAATKTRGMVEGSTRKIYRQKGTGRARHGGIRAPIFVGGGISFGPQPRDIHGVLPKQMKKRALSSALSYQIAQDVVRVVDGTKELPVKTKAFADMLACMHVSKRVLFVYGEDTKSAHRAMRNIHNVTVCPAFSVHTYDVMTHGSLIFTKDAMQSLIGQFSKK